MIRVVLDANVVVSAILNPHGHPARILAAWRDASFTLVTSQAILDEIERVLRYPRLQKWHGWPADQITDFIAELADLAVVAPAVTHIAEGAEDPDDNKYLACAVDGGAGYIVSGDEHLLKLREYRHIPIVTPRLFWEKLIETPSDELATD